MHLELRKLNKEEIIDSIQLLNTDKEHWSNSPKRIVYNLMFSQEQ